MDDAALREQFKINAMHGHDVGVWVCEGSGMYLTPVLFMLSMCPEPLPRPFLVKWKGEAAPPRTFRKHNALPLIYSECGRLPPWPYHVHLFAPQAPTARAVEQTSGLYDWTWVVPISGIILIFDERYDRPLSTFSLNRWLDRSHTAKPNSPLAWVQDQHVPYVIAALGYDEATTTLEQFRSHHDLAAEVLVLPGPPLADARRRPNLNQSSSIFSAVFERQQLAIDRDYAKSVVDSLFKQIESAR
jgi:hypothetical protein